MRRPCKICWIILALFLLGNIVLIGFWIDDEHGDRKREYSKEERHKGMRQHFIKNAGIDEEQFDEMFTLWKEHAEHMNTLEGNIDSLRQIVITETFSNHPDSLKVEELISKIANGQQQIEEANFKHYRKLRSVCKTDKQREQLDIMFRSKIMDRHPKRRYRSHRNRHQ